MYRGLSAREAQNASPWFFPSEKYIKQLLEEAGFEVERSQLQYRPTALTTEKEGGLQGWIELMGAPMLEKLPVEKREAAVNDVCETLSSVLTHEEDGSQWLGYVRLRALARKS